MSLSWHMLDWVSYVRIWALKQVVADATKVLGKSVEKWGKIKSYELLYAIYVSIYIYVTLLYVIYNMMCNGFVFGVVEYLLSVS